MTRKPIVFIIGSEFRHSEMTASYNRMNNFKNAFVECNYNVVMLSLTNGTNKGLSRNIFLFQSNLSLLNIFKWCFLLFNLRKRYPDAIVLFSNLHNRYILPFIFLNGLLKRKVIDIVEDPDAQFNDIKSHPKYKLYRPGPLFYFFRQNLRIFLLKRWYWKCFNLRLAITDNLKDKIQKITKQKTILVPILYYNKAHFNRLPNDKVSRESNYIAHLSSNSITKDGLMFLIECYCQLIEEIKDLRLVLLGRFNEFTKKQLIEVLKRHNAVDSVDFTGFVSDEDLKIYLRNSMALVITKPSNDLNNFNFPTRLINYLESGRPVLMPKYGVFERYFKDKESCYFFDITNKNSFCNKLKYINQASESELVKVGEAARNKLLVEFNAILYCKEVINTIS